MNSVNDNSGYAPISILLLAFGGPNSLNEIEPFLRNIFSGRALTPSLVEQVRERYGVIGGASPLLEITRQQARGLKNCLSLKGKDVEVFVAMRYWHPLIPDVLTALEQKGIRKVLYLIMSPYSSPAATGGYAEIIRRWQEGSSGNMTLLPVMGWHVHSQYLEAIAEKTRLGLAFFPLERRDRVHIIFTAHSLPLQQVKGDPYVDQTGAAVAEVMKRLGRYEHHLAFQSRGRGNGAWLQPDAGQVLQELARGGVREVLIVPVGFIADHLETLYDLDIMLKADAGKLGVELHRSPSLNDSPRLIEALAHSILSWFDQTA